MIAILALTLSARAADPERVDVLLDWPLGVSLFVHRLDLLEFAAEFPARVGAALRVGDRGRVGAKLSTGLPTTLSVHALVDYVPAGFERSGPLIGGSLGALVTELGCPYDDPAICPVPARVPYATGYGPIAQARLGWRAVVGADHRNGVTPYAQIGAAWLAVTKDPDELAGLFVGGLAGVGFTFDL